LRRKNSWPPKSDSEKSKSAPSELERKRTPNEICT
jgi:hypothetical protein